MSPSDLPAVPGALDLLRDRLQAQEVDIVDLELPLRALQRMGLTKADLRVHVEVERARNALTVDSDEVEDNCILALDLIDGSSYGAGLSWDAATLASIELQQIIRPEHLRASMRRALEPSDFFPPRREARLSDIEIVRISELLGDRIRNQSHFPLLADQFRVPKSGLTTRPAAILAPADRVILEALAVAIEPVLAELPGNVVWPRGGTEVGRYASFADAPRDWTDDYVVSADVDGFFESVDHALLVNTIGGSMPRPAGLLRALESFLDATMGSSAGLPQGPLASDSFATAYLLPIDRFAVAAEWNYVRYQDDILIGASSVEDGRRKIQLLERMLLSLKLRLSSSKTRIFRMSTYMAGLSGPSRRSVEFKSRMNAILQEKLNDYLSIQEDDELWAAFDSSDEDLHESIYGGTRAIDGIVNRFRERIGEPVADAYAEYVEMVVGDLIEHKMPVDMASTERDLRECFVMLAAHQGSKVVDIATVIRWFPQLAPEVATYLATLESSNVWQVSSILRAHLADADTSDWVGSWLCYVIEKGSSTLFALTGAVLTDLVRAEVSGPLRRSGAIRAIAAHGAFDYETVSDALRQLSPAVRAELVLAGLDKPDVQGALGL